MAASYQHQQEQPQMNGLLYNTDKQPLLSAAPSSNVVVKVAGSEGEADAVAIASVLRREQLVRLLQVLVCLGAIVALGCSVGLPWNDRGMGFAFVLDRNRGVAKYLDRVNEMSPIKFGASDVRGSQSVAAAGAMLALGLISAISTFVVVILLLARGFGTTLSKNSRVLFNFEIIFSALALLCISTDFAISRVFQKWCNLTYSIYFKGVTLPNTDTVIDLSLTQDAFVRWLITAVLVVLSSILTATRLRLMTHAPDIGQMRLFSQAHGFFTGFNALVIAAAVVAFALFTFTI